MTIAGDLAVVSELGGTSVVTFETERSWGLDGYNLETVGIVSGNVDISEDSELRLYYGYRAENPNVEDGFFQLWAQGTTFTNDGLISGNGLLRITNAGINNTLGDGAINLTNGGGVQYDFVIQNYVDLENTVYVGTYDNLTIIAMPRIPKRKLEIS